MRRKHSVTVLATSLWMHPSCKQSTALVPLEYFEYHEHSCCDLLPVFQILWCPENLKGFYIWGSYAGQPFFLPHADVSQYRSPCKGLCQLPVMLCFRMSWEIYLSISSLLTSGLANLLELFCNILAQCFLGYSWLSGNWESEGAWSGRGALHAYQDWAQVTSSWNSGPFPK